MVQINQVLADRKLAGIAFRKGALFYRSFTRFETHPSYDTLVLSQDSGVRLLSTVLTLAMLAGGVWAQDSKKKDPSQIGSRDVGKGINFYSIEKEIALGRQAAQEVRRQA